MKRNNCLWLLMWLMSLSLGAKAQEQKVTLSGYLKDGDNGEDLIGATVYVKEMETGAVSNVYGFFSVSLPKGEYTLMVNYLGYEQVNRAISLQKDEMLTVEMNPSTEKLEEVEIVAENPAAAVQNLEMGTQKLEIQTMKQLPTLFGEVDVLKSLQLLPGVTSSGETSSGFNVRGGSSDQNLMLLDESTIYNSSHLFGFISVFNPDAIKDVKLYKGGIPATYGGRLSSVLDVRQRDGNAKNWGASGGLGLMSSRLTLEGPLIPEKGSILLSGRRSYADVFLPAVSSDAPTVYFYDFNLKANYNFNENNRLFVSGYFGRDKFKVASVVDNSWGNMAFTARWNHLFGPNLFSNFTAVYSNYYYGLEYLGKGSEYSWDSNINNFNLKSDFTWFIDGNYTFDFGVNVNQYKFQPGEIRPISGSSVTPRDLDEKQAWEPAAYLSLEQKLSERFSLKYGLRFSSYFRMGSETILQYEDNKPVVYNPENQTYENGVVIGETSYSSGEIISSDYGLEPRLSAKYALNDRHSIKASYNRMRQYIHLISNTNSPNALDVWTPTGPYLKPEIADQVSLGYFGVTHNQKFEFSIETFYKDMQNLPDFVDGADLKFNNHLETELLTGEGRSYGLEVLIKKNAGKFNGWLSYTWSRSERVVKGMTPTDPGINNGDYYPSLFDKTHDLNLVGMYDLSKRIVLGANFTFKTGMPITYPASRYEYGGLVAAQYEGRNQNRMPNIHRLDLSVTLKPKPSKRKWKGEWVFSIYNVYNRKNAYDINFAQYSNENYSEFLSRKNETTATKSYIGMFPNVTYNLKF
ncbi:MAG: TonB-dependent receptor [Reichenbachiella sp.]|uniref:TonB-dependent receptor n=1 Tax=Reichenbachiella sp. TaxID=2184521 RepID=UPI00329A5C96